MDIFNLKSKELKTTNTSAGSIGDYKEYGITLNYGLSYKSMISLQYKKRELDYGTGTLDFYSYDFSIRKSFNSILSIEFGYKGNNANNLKIKDLSSMTYYLKKFEPTVSMEIKDKYIFFTKKEKDSTVKIGFLKKEDPYFELKRMKDSTKYIRFTIGKTFNFFYPNFFLEYGKTKIDSKIDSNFIKLVPDSLKKYLPTLPINLKRDEWYYKFGFSFFFRTPFKTLTNFEYSYIKINRDKSLSYLNNNQILKIKIGYFFTKKIILSFQGKYLQSQFNGEVPFLYNKYTQTTFDHKYGWINFSITYLWR